jgi:hypothetical protein
MRGKYPPHLLPINRIKFMEIHFIVNEAMEPMADTYFIPSLPADFQPQPHLCEIVSSGEYAKDGYFEVLAEKVEWILSLIEGNLDDGLMMWSDVDVVFNPKYGNVIFPELQALAQGKDLLFQSEFLEGVGCNTGIQIIRRNTRTLIFYAQLRLLMLLHNKSDRVATDNLLSLVDGVEWGLLPVGYSNESNGGLSMDSRLYHANYTPIDSLRSKGRRLAKALKLWNSYA